jgi:hypothetical protein
MVATTVFVAVSMTDTEPDHFTTWTNLSSGVMTSCSAYSPMGIGEPTTWTCGRTVWLALAPGFSS